MNNITFYISPGTAALRYASHFLSARGCNITTAPSAEVTHLLLPVPSFDPDGNLRGGGELIHMLNQLPKSVTVMGGNLLCPALSGYKTIDLLQDPQYLAENAAIVADCAVRIAGNNLPVVFKGCPILVIGWGRIGKCLAAQLKAMGADVTVAARKETDRAALLSLGYSTAHPETLDFSLMRYRVIYNTVPEVMLPENKIAFCNPDCIKIDLASKLGIGGKDVIWARGLPNRDAPESSGQLIAKTVLRLILTKEAAV